MKKRVLRERRLKNKVEVVEPVKVKTKRTRKKSDKK